MHIYYKKVDAQMLAVSIVGHRSASGCTFINGMELYIFFLGPVCVHQS